MNRRDFHTVLIGGAAASALPVSAAAVPATATRGPLLNWATAIARAQNRCSPALLAQQLKVPFQTAQGLYSALLQDGVIKAPLFGALAQANTPMPAIMRQAKTAPHVAHEDIKRLWDAVTQDETIELNDAPQTKGIASSSK